MWPASDRGAAAAVFNDIHALDSVYPLCRKLGVAIQAGGNCGVWPKAMGERFRIVYTFEPDPVNFRCLCANAPAVNVFKINAALGDVGGTVGLAARPDNVGAHQVDGSGDIPTLTIDDFALVVCDLIYLDIEGCELAALRGGAQTIARTRPVIVVEDKGMSVRYGVPPGEVEKYACERFGYRVVMKLGHDVVMVPC